MTVDEIVNLTNDIDDFLLKVVRNHNVDFPALAGVLMARMTHLAIDSDNIESMLILLPAMQLKLRENTNGKFH